MKSPEIYIQIKPSKKYADFSFRVGSGDSRQNVIGTIIYHRPLPPEGKIKYARLVEQRIGKDRKHYLQIVVSDISSNNSTNDTSKHPIASLDFGWYFEDSGRRIAGFSDSGNPEQAKLFSCLQKLMIYSSVAKNSSRNAMHSEMRLQSFLKN